MRKLCISSCMLSLLPCTMFLITSPAQAGLIGDTVTCAPISPRFCSQSSAVVGAGVEFTYGNPLPAGTQIFSVDFGVNDVLFTALSSYANLSDKLNFVDTTHAFSSESLLSTSGFFSTFAAPNISLSGGTLVVNLTGTAANIGDAFDIGLSTATAAPTPEPAELVGVGSMLLIAWMRKRKRKS